jgi:hypothetical protein
MHHIYEMRRLLSWELQQSANELPQYFRAALPTVREMQHILLIEGGETVRLHQISVTTGDLQTYLPHFSGGLPRPPKPAKHGELRWRRLGQLEADARGR